MPALTRRIRDERGFTIVEMMVVVLIIGILATIVVASYAFSLMKAKDATCKANLRILNEVVFHYRCDHQAWPDDLHELVPDYIKDDGDLICPSSGNEYLYDNTTGVVSCPECGN